MESGSRARVRVPSAGRACPLEGVSMCTAGRMPLASCAHPLCSECPAWEPALCPGPWPERRGEASGHTGAWDLCAPQASGRGSLGALPATGELGVGTPLSSVLCPVRVWVSRPRQHGHGDLLVGSGAGQVGAALELVGVVSRLPAALCRGAASPVSTGALTGPRPGRGYSHWQKLSKPPRDIGQRQLAIGSLLSPLEPPAWPASLCGWSLGCGLLVS